MNGRSSSDPRYNKFPSDISPHTTIARRQYTAPLLHEQLLNNARSSSILSFQFSASICCSALLKISPWSPTPRQSFAICRQHKSQSLLYSRPGDQLKRSPAGLFAVASLDVIIVGTSCEIIASTTPFVIPQYPTSPQTRGTT